MRAALFMTVSMGGFTLNDSIAKHASEVMNIGQVMFVRGAFATLFITALAWRQGALADLRLALPADGDAALSSERRWRR